MPCGTLKANELCIGHPLWFASLFQPVGIHQSREIIQRTGQHGCQEGRFDCVENVQTRIGVAHDANSIEYSSKMGIVSGFVFRCPSVVLWDRIAQAGGFTKST